eukprot:CAMPEP_0204186616 /NCGR_PEP_ID=MMETSP0361-20130328/56146_1 /ASSEMBLY_ACC=CAM_ASM_000343 /TAXON_ID=268821 /ORGANISM="Scrippsiella Hangoei, Strain SHTV-5" /LENGTH=154 /DNA_ID=CAMNT_0051146935 /DNA_START=55 /DNA_END=516 /DNA_ORIENTATION=-
MEHGRSLEDPGSGNPGNELQADCHTREAQQKTPGDESLSPLDRSDASSGSAGDGSGDNAPITRPVTSTFIAGAAMPQSSVSERGGTAQQKVQRFLNNNLTECALGGVITVNFLLILLETDSRAWYPGRGTETRSRWMVDLEWVCLAIFGTELAL